MGETDADSAGAAEPATLDVAAMLAAARDPDPDVQAARLREWACSDDAPRLMLDMRSADDFAAARLDGAVNIPFEDLDGRLHELPPRSKPLAVVLARAPSPEEQARVFAADFKGLPWRVRAFFLPSPELFDAHARAAGVDVRSGEVHPRDRGHLWEPSDMVARWLPRLEARMARAWNAEALLAGASPSSPSPSPESDLADETSRPLCVDVGCGAGRDAVWAAMRGWRVLALDSDARGLARCAALAETHGVARRVFPTRVDLLKTSPEEVLAMASRVAAGHPARPEDTNTNATNATNANAKNPPRAGSNPTPTPTPNATSKANAVRAVLAVRFLHRAFVRALPSALPASAAVCWFHFMRGAELTAVGRPNKSKDLLEVGELRVLFEEARWRVLRDDATTLPDGRPVSEFVAVNDAGDERGDENEPAGAKDDAKNA